MIRHVALLRLREDRTTGELAALARALDGMATSVEAVRALSHGPALGIQAGYDYAIAVDVEDEEGFDAYKHSPEHRELIKDHLRGLVTETARIQYRVEGAD